jgi:DNA replication protein DnaC
MSGNMEHLADILRRAQMARKESIPEEPRPHVCPRCQGAGYLRYDVPVDDPRFGQLVVCECTRAELDQKRQRMLLEKSQLAELQHFTFDKWIPKFRDPPAPRGTPDEAYHHAKRYAEDPLGSPLPWLFLYGTTGTGKTHLAAAIGNARIALGQPAIFMVVPDLLQHLRNTFSPNSEITYDELFEGLQNTPLLILDDLGTQNATPWATEKLYQLVNHRYNRRTPTVITMNIGTEGVDPRLWSRINDHQLVRRFDIKSEDRRTAEMPPTPQRPQRRTKVREEYHI